MSIKSNVNSTPGLSNPIKEGYGEYIVFFNGNGGQEIPKKIFDSVHHIFCSHLPAALALTTNKPADEYRNRYELIRKQVKQIDDRLEITFIPRTLYELILIRKCIKEDVKRGEVCKLLAPGMHMKNTPLAAMARELQKIMGEQQKAAYALEQELNQTQDPAKKKLIEEQASELELEMIDTGHRLEGALKAQLEERARREQLQSDPKCWHKAHFSDQGSVQENEEEGVREIAYRLNRSIAKKCVAYGGPVSYAVIAEWTEREIRFLEQQYEEGLEEMGEPMTEMVGRNWTQNWRK